MEKSGQPHICKGDRKAIGQALPRGQLNETAITVIAILSKISIAWRRFCLECGLLRLASTSAISVTQARIRGTKSAAIIADA